MAWSDEQLRNAAIIAEVGRSLGASDRDIQIAISAAIVESGLRNLDYGDRDSIGMFQQRDAWGSRTDRLDPRKSARMFFLGGAAGQRGLLDFADRNKMGMGEAAQAVQVSAFPERYDEQVGAAGHILSNIGGVPTTGGTLGDVPGLPDVSDPGPVEGSSTTEVNGVGEVTADETGIGALTFDGAASEALGEVSFDSSTSDALSHTPGQATGAVTHSAHPMQSSFMPTLTEMGITPTSTGAVQTAAGPGEVFTGKLKGNNPYDITEYNGKTVDYLTAAALMKAQEFWDGKTFNVTQGSYNPGGVAASGGTHDEGGVVDIIVQDGDWAGAVAALRRVGFAAWDRREEQGPWPRHIHAVLVGHERLAPLAKVQENGYLNNDNGLTGSAPDDGPRDWVNNRFVWGDALELEQQRRDSVVGRAKSVLGVPFQWGGEGYEGLDNFGFVKKVYGPTMKEMPTTLERLVANARPTPIKHAEIGSMLTWDNGQGVGVYLGGGMVVTPGAPGRAVEVMDANEIGDVWSVPVSMISGEDEHDHNEFTPVTTVGSTDDTPRGYGAATPQVAKPKPAKPQPASPGGRPVDFGV